MKILRLVSEILQPAKEMIDDLHTSDEERLNAASKMQEIENSLISTVIEYETQILKSRTQIITAEAKGESWMQRNWRPITMLTFLALVVFDSFGLLEFRLSESAWVLLKIGLGGYVVGRTAEKVTSKYLDANNSGSK